jgi:hypothetical protein
MDQEMNAGLVKCINVFACQIKAKTAQCLRRRNVLRRHRNSSAITPLFKSNHCLMARVIHKISMGQQWWRRNTTLMPFSPQT